VQKLPVLQITKAAYSFIWIEAKKIFPLVAQCSIIIILLHAFPSLINKTIFNTNSLFYLSISQFLFFLLTLPLNIKVTRAIVKQEEIGKEFFKTLFSLRTLKILLTILTLTTGVFLALAALVSLFFIIPSKIFPFISSQDTTRYFLNPTMIFILFFTVPYICIRTSLVIANAALDYKKPIRHTWRLSKGHVLRIAGIFLLTSLPGTICIFLVGFLLGVLLQNIPLVYGLLTLPHLYLRLISDAADGFICKHLNK